ncbi:MAG: acyltransferase [Solirubrobacterales bacterium]
MDAPATASREPAADAAAAAGRHGGPASARAAGSVPDVVAPPSGNPRFPVLDSVRAVSALSIVTVHCAIWGGASGNWYWPLVSHLDVGVPVFFLLSGFLLYRPMLGARVLGTPSAPVLVYARRRFLRIMPAYWVALTVLAIVTPISGVFSGNWWVYYGLLQNYPIYQPGADCVGVGQLVCGISPTWSLAIEVAFYAWLPVFAFAMAWLTSRLRRRWLSIELAVLAALAAISFYIQAGFSGASTYKWFFFSPLGRAWWFGLGMAIAALSVWVQQRGSRPRAVSWIADHPGALWAGALGVFLLTGGLMLSAGPLLAAPVGITTSEYLAAYALAGVLGVLAILPGVFGGDRRDRVRRAARHPVLAWLGLISYGIFLYHYPIILGLVDLGLPGWWEAGSFPMLLLATVGLTIACAALSYYLIERRLMRWK